MPHHARGKAIIEAIMTSLKKSLDKIRIISPEEAPNTFRMLISLLLWIVE